MTITDAILINPMAMEHARGILAGELAMLHNGVGTKKRIDWLVTQRDTVCRDASVFLPAHLAPELEAMSTRDAVSYLESARRNLAALNIGSTFRHLRNAERRMGRSGFTLDPISQQGAMLLLADDEDFASAYRRAVEPLLQHMESSPLFLEAEQRYSEIMSTTDLETNKQRLVIEHVMQTLPEMLIGMPGLESSIVREIAYLNGRLLDQDIMLALVAVIRELGAGVIDQLSTFIIDDVVVTYRMVLSGLINDRITELKGDRQPVTSHIEPNAPTPLTADPSPVQNQDATQLPDLLSIIETAEYLRVTRTTIHRLLRSGALPGTHVGRRHLITRKSIENYLALSGNE